MRRGPRPPNFCCRLQLRTLNFQLYCTLLESPLTCYALENQSIEIYEPQTYFATGKTINIRIHFSLHFAHPLGLETAKPFRSSGSAKQTVW